MVDDPAGAHPRTPMRRHGRRPIRSALTGPLLHRRNPAPDHVQHTATAVFGMLRAEYRTELQSVRLRVASMPTLSGESQMPQYYSLFREANTIVLHRHPMMRARGLHVDDREHRERFIAHCVHRAVCEYLHLDPWEVFPGMFDHY